MQIKRMPRPDPTMIKAESNPKEGLINIPKLHAPSQVKSEDWTEIAKKLPQKT